MKRVAAVSLNRNRVGPLTVTSTAKIWIASDPYGNAKPLAGVGKGLVPSQWIVDS